MNLQTTKVIAASELTPDEQSQYIDWSWQYRGRTTLDPRLTTSSRFVFFISQNQTEPTAYMPVQAVLMCEAFIPNPKIGRLEVAGALGTLNRTISEAAKAAEISFVYAYVPVTEEDYLNKMRRHGWEEVEGVRLMRKSA